MQILRVKTPPFLCCPSAGWLCCAAQTLYNASFLPPALAGMLGQESVGASSAQAFLNNSLTSQVQEENNKVCFRKAASVLGKCGILCGKDARRSGGCRWTIVCCCEKPLPPTASGPKTSTQPSGCWRKSCSRALFSFVGSSSNAWGNGLAWKHLQKCFFEMG